MTKNNNYGHIIFLNGTSNSGKTSIAKELQRTIDIPYAHLSFDNFFLRMIEDYGGEENVVRATIYMPQVTSPFHHLIAAYAKARQNIIVDHVLRRPGSSKECAELLSDYEVLFVGVYCPVEVLREREKQRKDRRVGLAEGQLEHVHAGKTYDIEVDTSKNTPSECATQIVECLKNRDNLEKQIQTAMKFIKDIQQI